MHLCFNPFLTSIIGTPFYLMRYIPGRVLKDPSLPQQTPRERGQVYSEMVRVLAAIHSVDVGKANLDDFGKHGVCVCVCVHINACTCMYLCMHMCMCVRVCGSHTS